MVEEKEEEEEERKRLIGWWRWRRKKASGREAGVSTYVYVASERATAEEGSGPPSMSQHNKSRHPRPDPHQNQATVGRKRARTHRMRVLTFCGWMS